MEKVLVTLDYEPSSHKMTEAGFSVARALGLDITLQHVVTDELYFKILDIATIMGICNQKKNIAGLQKMRVELQELSVQFLNQSKLHLGNAIVHTLLKNGDSNETVLEMAKETEADVIVIIMALHNRNYLKYKILNSITENVSINSSVPVLIIPTKKKLQNKYE